MNRNELKKQSDTKSEHHDKAIPQHDKMQGVTTNPNEVGAGGAACQLDSTARTAELGVPTTTRKTPPTARAATRTRTPRMLVPTSRMTKLEIRAISTRPARARAGTDALAFS